MRIILSRHGNTFGPGDPVVWTGSSNDLPLVKKGLEQAERFAAALLAREIRPAAVYCSPLQRTSTYAKVVLDRLKLPFPATVDPRINEIDYGEWTGCTNDEVKSRFGDAAFKGWDERAEWPSSGNWGGSPEKAIGEARSFVADLIRRHSSSDTVVVITSNGRLRYFLALVPGEFERRVHDGTFKVKTGNVCVLNQQHDRFEVPIWNANPAELK